MYKPYSTHPIDMNHGNVYFVIERDKSNHLPSPHNYHKNNDQCKKSLLPYLYFSIIASSAQSESVKPTFGVELDREVAHAIIEGKIHTDVILELKALPAWAIYSPLV